MTGIRNLYERVYAAWCSRTNVHDLRSVVKRLPCSNISVRNGSWNTADCEIMDNHLNSCTDKEGF